MDSVDDDMPERVASFDYELKGEESFELELFDSQKFMRSQLLEAKEVLHNSLEIFENKDAASTRELSAGEKSMVTTMKDAIAAGDLGSLRGIVTSFGADPDEFSRLAKELGRDLEGTGLKVRYTIDPSPVLPGQERAAAAGGFGTLTIYDRESVSVYTGHFGPTRGNQNGSCQSVEAVLARLGKQVVNRLPK